jgi:hypothetical protein
VQLWRVRPPLRLCGAWLVGPQQAFAGHCLPVIDVVIRYGAVPSASLDHVVRTLCRLMSIDGAATWTVVRNLLSGEQQVVSGPP